MSASVPAPSRLDDRWAGGTGAAARPLPWSFTMALGVLVVAATLFGLLAEDAYGAVPPLTRETWQAQDAVTLVSVPVLLAMARRARAGSLPAHVASTGILLWLTYAYAHLAIGAPFNTMFLVYVAIFGLAGAGTLDGLLRVDVASVDPAFSRAPRRAATGFLTLAGVGIAGLWLGEIVVALPDGLPANVHLAELPNPTWLLDLGWIIPMSLLAARMLHRRHPAGFVVTGALLVMLLVLSMAMLAVTPFALVAGIHEDATVASQLVVFSIVFTVLGAAEVWLLAASRRRMDVVGRAWLRSSWWPLRTPAT